MLKLGAIVCRPISDVAKSADGWGGEVLGADGDMSSLVPIGVSAEVGVCIISDALRDVLLTPE